jgi:allantoinase
MPLNSSPVTTDFNSLQLKTNAARKSIHVNCGFWGGVVPGNLAHIEELLAGGAFGLKAFLTHSGIDEFPETEPAQLRDALHILKRYDRPLLVHCELSESHEGTQRLKENPGSYAAYLASRPKSWENRAIETMISLCRETGARVHIVHLSSAEALPSIHRAKEEGLPLTVETAPHYLFFAAEEIEDRNTLFKCAPPIRERANNEKLWEALKDGTIDFVATDHSPAPPENKEIGSGDLEKAWGGIAGLQFSLPVTWTAGQTHDVRLQDICAWLSEKPAAFLGLENSKGKIKPGYDADIVIWNPEEAVSLSGPLIQHRHKQTPYSGLPMKGDVTTTLVSGRVVYTGRTFESLHAGRLLLRKPID